MEEKRFRSVTHMNPAIYRDFYKIYYKDRLKVFNVVSLCVSILAFLGAAILQSRGAQVVWIALLLWLGLFCIVYPRAAYRRPYKRARNNKVTTNFTFYDTYVAEKTNSEKTDYSYSDLMKMIETNKYIFIYHAIDSVSIVEKASVKEGGDELASFLKTKIPYKRVKA